jgi:predicted oxidoreductase
LKRIELIPDLSFSQLVHGHWRLNDWNLSASELIDLSKSAVDLGITTIDHAAIYGNYNCESLFGNALAVDPGFRKKLEIVSKCGIQLLSDRFPSRKVKHYDYSAAQIIASAENSLINLRTDYLDVLLLHRPSPFYHPEEIAAAFMHLYESGKVRAFGVSNFTPQQLDTLRSFLNVPIVTNQLEISPLQLNAFEDGTMDHLLLHRIHPMAWSPLGGGQLFTGTTEQHENVRKVLQTISMRKGIASIETIVYAWLLAHPTGIMPIIGSGKIDRLQVAVDALNCSLTTEEWFEIYVAGLGQDVA